MANANMVQNYFILFFISVLTSEFAYAQQTPGKTDSTHIYKNN